MGEEDGWIPAKSRANTLRVSAPRPGKPREIDASRLHVNYPSYLLGKKSIFLSHTEAARCDLQPATN